MNPALSNSFKTTVGDLTTAFYEEALREFGDESLAREIASHLVREHLSRTKHR